MNEWWVIDRLFARFVCWGHAGMDLVSLVYC